MPSPRLHLTVGHASAAPLRSDPSLEIGQPRLRVADARVRGVERLRQTGGAITQQSFCLHPASWRPKANGRTGQASCHVRQIVSVAEDGQDDPKPLTRIGRAGSALAVVRTTVSAMHQRIADARIGIRDVRTTMRQDLAEDCDRIAAAVGRDQNRAEHPLRGQCAGGGITELATGNGD